MAAKISVGGKLALLTMAVLVVAIVVDVTISNDKEAVANAAAEVKQEEAAVDQADAREQRFQLALGGAITLMKAMRDPDSFRVAQVVVTAGDKVACYEYRARNGFGGMDASRAVLVPAGFFVDGQPGFRDQWVSFCVPPRGQDLTDEIAISLQQYRSMHPD